MTSPQQRNELTLAAALQVLQAGSMSVEDLMRHIESQAGGGSAAHQIVTVRDFIDGTVRKSLTNHQRTSWGPYLGLLVDGYAGLCACKCDNCLDHFKGDSSWTPCPCVISESCDCSKAQWKLTYPDVNSCTDTFHGYGDRAFDSLSITDLTVACQWAQQRAYKRVERRKRNRSVDGRPSERGDGRHAAEQCRSAYSAAYKLAIDDSDLSNVTQNLALKVPYKQRPDTVARAYDAEQLEEIWQAIFTSGSNDVELDMLIVWSMLELGSRRGGLIGMTIADLKVHASAIRLGEKNEKVDDQPASPALITTLLDHALRRGGDIVAGTVDGLDPADVTPFDVLNHRATLKTDRPVLYYKNPNRTTVTLPDGTEQEQFSPNPLSRKRFETLFNRLKRKLPWLDEMHGRPHDLRRTGATFIERAFGYAVAQQWLRHTLTAAVGTYVKAGDDEVRRAHAWWTGQPTT